MTTLDPVRHKVVTPTDTRASAPATAFFGWTCPECDAYHATADCHRRADGTLSVRCGVCGAVETIPPRTPGGTP